jgi:hypothetical protein
MSESESPSSRVLELAKEFLDRYRKGQRPSLREYITRYPELAAEIKDVLPTMAMMESSVYINGCMRPDAPPPRDGVLIDLRPDAPWWR